MAVYVWLYMAVCMHERHIAGLLMVPGVVTSLGICDK